MGTRMQQKRGTATQWQTGNPVLAVGEFGVAIDTGVVKVGDGVNNWNDLPAILGSTYLPILGKAADSNLLDGNDSSYFLPATGKAADSDKLDGFDSAYFLPATGKAADADKLDGLDSLAFTRFQSGTAAQRAALSTTGLPVGAIFYETDTERVYRYVGSNTWRYETGDKRVTVNDTAIGLAMQTGFAFGSGILKTIGDGTVSLYASGTFTSAFTVNAIGDIGNGFVFTLPVAYPCQATAPISAGASGRLLGGYMAATTVTPNGGFYLTTMAPGANIAAGDAWSLSSIYRYLP